MKNIKERDYGKNHKELKDKYDAMIMKIEQAQTILDTAILNGDENIVFDSCSVVNDLLLFLIIKANGDCPIEL